MKDILERARSQSRSDRLCVGVSLDARKKECLACCAMVKHSVN